MKQYPNKKRTGRGTGTFKPDDQAVGALSLDSPISRSPLPVLCHIPESLPCSSRTCPYPTPTSNRQEHSRQKLEFEAPHAHNGLTPREATHGVLGSRTLISPGPPKLIRFAQKRHANSNVLIKASKLRYLPIKILAVPPECSARQLGGSTPHLRFGGVNSAICEAGIVRSVKCLDVDC